MLGGWQIPCRGRGQVPAPESVNSFVWELMSWNNNYPGAWTVLHCTHGFNRTGAYFVILHLPARATCVPTERQLKVDQITETLCLL